ncbi:hypothetical protein VPH35_017940 [Triticum aestivum]
MSRMKMLVVIEFGSDVSDDDWKNFHSFLLTMGRGSHIIIISRIQTFRSVDPAEHPRLLKIADEVASQLHTQGSLVATNAYADLLRRNLNAQFWHCLLDKGIRMIKRNIGMYGVHPSMLIEEGHPVDITDFAMHPLSMIPYMSNVSIKKESPSVTFGELLSDPSVRPKEDFILISWESRIPPHNLFSNFVISRAQDTDEGSALPGRK